MSRGQERLRRRQRWAGAAVVVVGLVLVATVGLVWRWPMIATETTGSEGSFVVVWSLLPAEAWIALGTLGVLAVLTGAWSALGRRSSRRVHLVLTLLFLAASVYVGWQVVRVRRLVVFGELMALPRPWELLPALAGAAIGAAGSPVLARTKRPPPDDNA